MMNEAAPVRPRAILLLCAVVAIIEGFDLQAAGVAAPRLAPALGLTPGQLGLFFSAATFGLIFGALAGGRIADLYGRKAGLVISLTLFGLFSILTAFAYSFETLFAARFLTGVGLGGALPNLVAIAAESSGPERRASAVSTMYAGMPAGGAVAAMVSMAGLHGDWHTIFIVGGAAPLLVVPLLLAFLPRLRVAPDHAGEQGAGRALGVLFGGGNGARTLLLWAGFFFSLLVLYLLLNWLPALLVSRGLTPGEAGAVQIALNLAGALASLAAGRAMDRSDRPATVAIAFAALLAALAYLGLMPASVGFAIAGGAFVGAAIIAVQAILYGLAPTFYPAALRGTGVGAAVAAGRLGSVAGPLLAGVLVAGGRSPVQVLMALIPIALAGGIATFLLVRMPRVEEIGGR
ncbi:MAG TPA: 3-(3-hydroxy-phenyl)propionate transporter MhpT [Allosphingosinicella sp.]